MHIHRQGFGGDVSKGYNYLCYWINNSIFKLIYAHAKNQHQLFKNKREREQGKFSASNSSWILVMFAASISWDKLWWLHTMLLPAFLMLLLELLHIMAGSLNLNLQVAERILCRHPFNESKRAYVVPQHVEELLKCYWSGSSGTDIILVTSFLGSPKWNMLLNI